MTTFKDAAKARSTAEVRDFDRPSQRRMAPEMGGHRGSPATIRAKGETQERVVYGVASVTETPYEMHDMFGPYTEVVDGSAFDATLARNPLVEFTLNHGAGGGLPMAHTRNRTLALSVGESGLTYEATVDHTRTDVADMLKALERGDLAEASFKFRIVKGQWSPDYTEYRIVEVDLDRGDVSAVNFGANPYATSSAREQATEPRRLVVIDEDEVRHRRIPGI